MITITLQPAEYIYAAQAGFLRQASNVCKGRKHAYRLDSVGYNEHVTGAVGEFVVSLALGVAWRGPGTLRAGDVGHLQVRATEHERGCLILYDRDDANAVFVLVTGRFPEYIVRGWCYAHEGQQPRYVKHDARFPTYFVPQSALRPIEQLQRMELPR